MHELAEQLLSYLKAAWRYRWYGAGLAWTVAIAGWVIVAQLPNRYEASARVYVDTQSVLRPLLAGLAVQPNVSQIVTMMSRTLISRPNVEKVVRMADLGITVKTPEDREQLEPWARAFYHASANAFLTQYLETAGSSPFLAMPPEELGTLLRIQLVEKALYELLYELDNRPTWAELPLRGLLSLFDDPAVIAGS